jgi:ubiquinone/menaquinone biosynthesis C-methylase UbiE
MMQTKDHWENVYKTKATDAVSWYQQYPERSLRLVRETGVPLDAPIIDIGGGASKLVDELLESGYSNLTVLDISAAALAAAQQRLGDRSESVKWIESDITGVSLPKQAFDVWHDRAVFHFLTSAADRKTYIEKVLHAIKPGGHVIIATFAEDGPEKCSGLPVMRYSAEALSAELGEQFKLIKHEKEEHHTPFGTVQSFGYCYFRLR